MNLKDLKIGALYKDESSIKGYEYESGEKEEILIFLYKSGKNYFFYSISYGDILDMISFDFSFIKPL